MTNQELMTLLLEAKTALRWQEQADADPAVSVRKGYYEVAEEYRREVLPKLTEALSHFEKTGGDTDHE